MSEIPHKMYDKNKIFVINIVDYIHINTSKYCAQCQFWLLRNKLYKKFTFTRPVPSVVTFRVWPPEAKFVFFPTFGTNCNMWELGVGATRGRTCLKYERKALLVGPIFLLDGLGPSSGF